MRKYFETWLDPDRTARRMTSPQFRSGISGIYKYLLLNEGDLKAALIDAGLLKANASIEQVNKLVAILSSHIGYAKTLQARPPIKKLFSLGTGISRYLVAHRIPPKSDWLYFNWRLFRLYRDLRPLGVEVNAAEVFRQTCLARTSTAEEP